MDRAWERFSDPCYTDLRLLKCVEYMSGNF